MHLEIAKMVEGANLHVHFWQRVHSLGRILRGGLFVLLCLSQSIDAAAQERDLTELSLEDLMDIEVTTVGKKQQTPSRIPAAVYVITQDDIRRSGASNIPDVLRMVPGIEVAQIDNSTWAISIRGFNFRSSNKLLVLIDGRAVYYPTYSNVFWDIQDLLLEDIQRIEVVRGPGASLWGANAVNGVINIVTKHAKDTQGGLISVNAGSYDQAAAAVRYGTTVGRKGYYRIFGKYGLRDNLVDLPDGTGLKGRPYMLRGGFRSDWNATPQDGITVEGDLYQGSSPQAIYRSPYLLAPISTDTGLQASGGDVLLRWTHRLAANSETALQIYYDRSRHPDILLEQFHEVVDVDFQHHLRSDRHDLLWGAGFRNTTQDSRGSWELSLNPSRRGLRLFSGFLQDDIQLVANKLMLTAGARLEHNGFTGTETQPTLRFLWTPNSRHGAWAAISRALRTPSIWENAVDMKIADDPLPDGTPVFANITATQRPRSEELLAYEVGYRTEAFHKVWVDTTAFYQRYNHLSSILQGEPFFATTPTPRIVAPLLVANLLHGKVYGTEISSTYTPTSWWKLTASYSWLRQITKITADNILAFPGQDGENPSHQFQIHSYLTLPRHLELDSGLYFVGRMPLQANSRYTRLDLRLGWRPTNSLEFSLGGQNLLQGTHYEFIPPGEYLVSGKIERAVYGRMTWRF